MKTITFHGPTCAKVSTLIFALFLFWQSLAAACDRSALTTYMSASDKIQALDASVHNFLKSLNTDKVIELLIVASSAPDYIAEFHRNFIVMSVNQPVITDDLNEFYLCTGLQQKEIDSRFNDTFEKHYQLLDHLQQHDQEFTDKIFSTKLDEYHQQSISIFGDNDSGVLQPLKTTENIFRHLIQTYAQQATIFDFWELKKAKGTEHFMNVTGLDIQHHSPQAQLQKHLDRGLSQDSFLLFGGPGEGEEYPQSIYHLARELSGQVSNGPLPTAEQLPNRSKLAIIVATSEENEQSLLKVLAQYETAANLFKNRAATRYGIETWQATDVPARTGKEVLQNWAVSKLQTMSQQGEHIDALLDPKSSPNWSEI